MPKSPRVEAAEYYARKHHITTHQAFEDSKFKYLWNYSVAHPRSKETRKRLGLPDAVKMSRKEYAHFASLREFGDTP